MNSNLKIAYDHGVMQALNSAGYSSVEEFQKEAESLRDNLIRAAILGIPGAVTGALSAGEDSRLEGAGLGALAGGALGALGSAAPIMGKNVSGRGLERHINKMLAGYGLGTVGGGVLGGRLADSLSDS